MTDKVDEENIQVPATPLLGGVERRGRKLTEKGKLLRFLDDNPEDHWIEAMNWVRANNIDIQPREKRKLGRILRAHGRIRDLVAKLTDEQIKDLLAHLERE